MLLRREALSSLSASGKLNFDEVGVPGNALDDLRCFDDDVGLITDEDFPEKTPMVDRRRIGFVA